MKAKTEKVMIDKAMTDAGAKKPASTMSAAKRGTTR
jgi:hypothetical protein